MWGGTRKDSQQLEGRQEKSEGSEPGHGTQSLPETGAALEPDGAHQGAHGSTTADRLTTERDDFGKSEQHRDPREKKNVNVTMGPTATK